MQVQVHTDATIQGGDSLETWAHEEINTKLARLKEHVVRVEVFLTGVDALKATGGPGKKCVLETRANGRPPVAVNAEAEKVKDAFNAALEKLRRARIKTQFTLSLLNGGQQLIIATALVLMLWRATQGVASGELTLGDLVMVNAFMIQLYIPLNFLGVLYRESKQSLTDLDRMFTLLEREREVADAPNATALRLSGARGRSRRRSRAGGGRGGRRSGFRRGGR